MRMNKLIVTTLACTLLFAGCASKTTMTMPDGTTVETTDQASYVKAQTDAWKYQMEMMKEAIANVNNTEQGMLVAFWMGSKEQLRIERLPTWDERVLPYFKTVVPMFGGWSFGDSGSRSGLVITGDDNTLQMNQIDGSDWVYDADTSDSWNYSYERDYTYQYDYQLNQPSSSYNTGE